MEAVIFDLDQTLLDRDRSLRNFIRWQCQGMLGPYIDHHEAAFTSRFLELDANGSVWKDSVYATLIDEFSLADWSVQELLAVYEACFCAFSVPREGTIAAIHLLSAQYKLGLISNGRSPFQQRNFRALGIHDLFASIIVSQSVGLRKPDPRIFHLGCQELDVLPEAAIYVGDRPISDIKGAKSAGLKTILMATPSHSQCEVADAICSTMVELPSIVENII